MSSPSTLDDRLFKAARELHRGTNRCRAILDRFLALPIDERLGVREYAFRDVLRSASATLFTVSKPFRMASSGRREPIDFYFWPGYQLLGLTGDSIRLFQESTHADRVIPSGNGFRGSEGVPYEYTNTCVWFDHLLNLPHAYDHARHQPFVPGGMHPWTIRGNKPPMLKYGGPLNVLAISITPGSAAPDYPGHGLISIPVRPSDLRNSGKIIAAGIKSKIVYDHRWPCPSPPHPSLSMSRKLTAKQALLQENRQKLYSIWIAANMGQLSSEAWVDDYAADFQAQGLCTLADIINRERGLAFRLEGAGGHRYPYWYTLILDKVCSAHAEYTDLGSAIVLSSHQIDPWYFAIVRPWLIRLYLLMRQADNETLIAYKSRDDEAAKLFYALGHALKEPTQQLATAVEQIVIAARAADTATLEDACDHLNQVLKVSDGIAVMASWLTEAKRPEERKKRCNYYWEPSEQTVADRVSLSPTWLNARLQAIQLYAEDTGRTGNEMEICHHVRRDPDVVSWQCRSSAFYLVRDQPPKYVKVSHPPGGGVFSIISELMINAVRYNDPTRTQLRIVVAADDETFTLLVANQRHPNRKAIDLKNESVVNQNEFTGIRLVHQSIGAFGWERISVPGERLHAPEHEELRMLLTNAGFCIHDQAQVTGFRCVQFNG